MPVSQRGLRSVCAISVIMMLMACAAPSGGEGSDSADLCQSSATIEDADYFAALEQQYDFKKRAYLEGRAELLGNEFYADDVMLLSGSDRRPIDGKDAVVTMFETILPDRSKTEMNIIHRYRGRSGQFGYDLANVSVFPKEPGAAPMVYREVFVWECIDGDWRVVLEAANSDSFLIED